MRDFFVPRDLLLFGSQAGMQTDFSMRGFTAGHSESVSSLVAMVPGSAPAQPWTPAEIPGSVWVDADTVTLNGSTIAAMTDKVGGVIAASQPTAAAQPTLVADVLNGEDVMQFDGADWLSFGTALGKPANWTIFVVGMFASMGAKTNMCGSGNAAGQSAMYWGDIGVGRAANDGKIEYSFGDGTNYSYGRSTSAVVTTGQWFFCCRRYTSGQDSPVDRVNGVGSPVSKESVAATACGGTAYAYRIGMAGEYAGQYLTSGSRFKGFVCVPSAISDADASRLEGYYAHLCGLTSILPSDHPYKSSAPTL